MIISVPFTFSAGAVIISSQHNSNFSIIYGDYNGFIDNNNISASAAIAYSKLNLALGIVNADINASAAISASKINLTIPGAIGGTTPAAGTFTALEATTTLKLGTTHQGDVLYDNGTSLVRLTPGTSGQFFTTGGASANPSWTSGLFAHSEFKARLTDGTTTPNAFDLTGGFTTGTDFASNTYTVPTTGKYIINVQYTWTKDVSATARNPKVSLKNGSTVIGVGSVASSTNGTSVFSISINGIFSFTAADAITVVTTTDSGNFSTSDMTLSWFSGALIR